MKKLLLIALTLLSCAGSQKTGTLSFVTLDEEAALGREIATQSPKLLRLVRNHEISDFFNQLGKELGAKSDWTGLDYTVFILNEPDLNHFSLPGGSIYLCRGLIEKAETAHEVAAALSHEIAHIGRRNAVNRMASKYSYAFAAQSVFGQNPELATQILQSLFTKDTILDYPEKEEHLADALAAKYLWKANYDPEGLLLMVQKMRLQEKENKGSVALLRRTHPPFLNRINRIRKELTSMPHHGGLRRDLADFSRIRDQLMRIPR
ncbi:M48 family metalloprotease [bacterium]|nr:M48 family metalloprotease [bacterium]